MLYAMSDIHGFANIFLENFKRIDLSGKSRLVLLGDYIDYGPESDRTLRLVFETQKRYGAEKVIVLRGNHEEAFLEWIDTYGGPHAGDPDFHGVYHDGQSHYYLDGTVNESGRIPILAYDEKEGTYSEIV